MTPLIHQPEYKTDINSYTAGERGIETNIATESIPVAIKSQSYEFALTIEHWAAAVAARDIVGSEETEGQLTSLRVDVATVVARLQQVQDFSLHRIVGVAGALFDFLDKAGHGRR